jgi:hypothetical protein
MIILGKLEDVQILQWVQVEPDLETPRRLYQLLAHPDFVLIKLQARIDRRRETSNFAPWKDTRALASYKDLLKDPAVRPDAVFIGIPASCHGEETKGDIESLDRGNAPAQSQ